MSSTNCVSHDYSVGLSVVRFSRRLYEEVAYLANTTQDAPTSHMAYQDPIVKGPHLIFALFDPPFESRSPLAACLDAVSPHDKSPTIRWVPIAGKNRKTFPAALCYLNNSANSVQGLRPRLRMRRVLSARLQQRLSDLTISSYID